MRALSIRQPYAELILRGTKTVEYRSRPTRLIGERFYVYASRQWALGGYAGGRFERLAGGTRVTGDNIVVPDAPLPPWMVELAEALKLWRPGELPTGVIVGSAVIDACERVGDVYHWRLRDAERLTQPRRPDRHPQPAWFRPF